MRETGGLAAALATAVLIGAGSALAETPGAIDTPVVSLETASRYYPDRAQRMEVSGWARVRCIPREDATLADCVVVGEEPAAYGFGQAVTMLATKLKVRPDVLPTVVGKPAYFKVVFQIPDRRGLDRDPVKPLKREVIEAARPAGADAVGMATVVCAAPLRGRGPLSACIAVGEGPVSQGYAAAAIDLAVGAYQADADRPPAEIDFWLGRQMLEGMGEDREFAIGGGYGLVLTTPIVADRIAALPESGARVACGWTAEGHLRDCHASPSGPTPSPEAVAAIVALAPDLRLTRSVTFSINWGQ